jgi:hypothetical protein
MVHGKETENAVVSPAQSAFMQIHEHLLQHEVAEAQANGGVHTTKLLVPAGQTGTLIGKGGTTVKALQEASGTQINLREAPPCAMPDDKVRDASRLASPCELLASPRELVASPSELLASPSELLASPSELLASPSESS